ncbi:hypothetical protein DENSPDRAFT_842660 [Dentipellis sp. KUC8613]|nr:hypothetical protein DENSPDRAFT_842660 [Dentipellis sp. KUC8613]
MIRQPETTRSGRMFLVNSLLSAVEYWDKAEGDRFASPHGSTVIKAAAIPDARAELEMEMKAVELVMSSLRTRYNSLALVNRLPSEALAHIFQHFHDDRLFEYAGACKGSWGVMQCVRLTHVCRRWRMVGIDHPGLWCQIQIGTKLADEFLHRARRESLRITYDSSARRQAGPRAHDMEYVAGLISQNLFRVLSLHLNATSTEFIATILPALCDPMSILEEVSLDITSSEQNMRPASIVSLPPDFFQQSAPRLLHLHVSGWMIPWPSLTFNTITHLALTRPNWDSGEAGEFGELLSALSRMPLLEVLHLEHVFPPPLLSHDGPWRPFDGLKQFVSLPSLREVVLAGVPRACYLVLDHIAAPPTTEYRIYGTAENDWESKYFVRWFHKLAKTSPPICILHVSQVPESFKLSAYCTSERLPAGKLLFDLSLEGLSDEGNTRGEMQKLFDALPLVHVQILRIRYSVDSPFSDWSGIFCGHTDLRHISIECEIDCEPEWSISTIERLLAIDLSPRKSDFSPPYPPPAFPSLESLTLKEINFGHDEAVYDKFLIWLGRWGAIKELILRYCISNTNLVDRLKMLPFELVMHKCTMDTGLQVTQEHPTQTHLPSMTWPAPNIEEEGRGGN